MTRAEAIYILNHLIQKIEASPNKTNILTKEKQALEVAIEALKEQRQHRELVNVDDSPIGGFHDD